MATPPTPEDVQHVVRDYPQYIISALTGVGLALGFLGRSVKSWANKIGERNKQDIAEVRERLSILEAARHENDLKIVALQSLGRQVESIDRRLDAGFEAINERLDAIFRRSVLIDPPA